MIRNLKALGLVMAAAFSISGLAAVTAQAETDLFSAGATPGTNTASGIDDITVQLAVEGLKYEEHGAACPDGEETMANGDYTSTITLPGETQPANRTTSGSATAIRAVYAG